MKKATKSIYEIPVFFFVSFGQTLEGETLQGITSGTILKESYFGEFGAKIKLRLSPAFWKNYNKLSPEERKKWNPFKFREGKIERILTCKERYIAKNGQYICGLPTTDDEPDENSLNGYFGGCCIVGYDNDDLSFCPYNENSQYNKKRKIDAEIREFQTKIKELKSKKKELSPVE